MNIEDIIDKYYPAGSDLREIYLIHANKVKELSLTFALKHPELHLDMKFIEEAAMLHDIGIFMTDAPRIHCFGKENYLCHGYLGAELLRELGYGRHARVCERHTGTGISKECIRANGWNLPEKDFFPETLEEQLICFADKFYSKTKFLHEARTFGQVVESMGKISADSVEKVKIWAKLFM